MKLIRPASFATRIILALAILVTASAIAVGQIGPSPVEDLALRTVDSKTYHNPNGSTTVRFYGQPVHFQDEQGKWKDISTRISQGDRSLGKGKGIAHFWNEENGLNTYFPDFSDQAIRFESEDNSLTLTPVNSSKSAARSGADRIQYSEVWKDTDLIYTVRSGMVKEEIIVNRPNGLQAYSFELKSEGVFFSQDEKNGGISCFDKNGDEVWYLPPAFVYEKGKLANYTAAPMRLRREADGTQFVDIMLDQQWMNAPGRHYPVVIDPTVVSGSINRQEQKVRHYFFQTLTGGPLDWIFSFTTDYHLLTAESQPYFKLGTAYGGSTLINVLGPSNTASWSTSGRINSLAAGSYHATLFGGSWTFLVTLGYGTATLSLTYNRTSGTQEMNDVFNRSLSNSEVVTDFQVIKAQSITVNSSIGTVSGTVQTAPHFNLYEVNGSTETAIYAHTQVATSKSASLGVVPGKLYRVRAMRGIYRVVTSTDHYDYPLTAVSGTIAFPHLTVNYEKALAITTTPNKIVSTIVAPATQQVAVWGRITKTPDSSNVRSIKPYVKIMDGTTLVWPSTPDVDTIAYDLFERASYISLTKDHEYQLEFACGKYDWTESVLMNEPDPPEIKAQYSYHTYHTVADSVNEFRMVMPNSTPVIGAALYPASDSIVGRSVQFTVPVSDSDWNASTLYNKQVVVDLRSSSTGNVEKSVTLSENAIIPAGGSFSGQIDLLSLEYQDAQKLYWSARVYDGLVWSASSPLRSVTIDATNPVISSAQATVGSNNSINVSWTASDTNLKEFVLNYSNGSTSQSFTLDDATSSGHILTDPGFDQTYQVVITARDKAGNTASYTVSSIYTLPEQSKLYQPVSAKFATTAPAAVVFKQVAAESYKIERTDNTTSTTVSTAYLTPQNLTAGPDVVDGGTTVKTFCYNPPTDAQSGWTITPHHVYQYRITTTNKKPTTPDTAVYTTDISILNNPPVLAVTPPSTLSEGEISLQAAASDLDGDLIQYKFELYLEGELSPKQASSWQTSGSYVFRNVENGTYKWVVWARDGLTDGTVCQEASADQLVVVRWNVAPSLILNAPTELRVGQDGAFSVTATDPDGTCVSYLWAFGDGSTSADVSPTHHYALAGEYTFTVQVTDNDGAVSQATSTVKVFNTTSGSLLADEIWNVNTTIGGDIVVPQGLTLTIKNGVNVVFNGNYGIFVYGTLKVEGLQTSRVTFKPLFGNRNSWKGIRFEDAAASSIQYADIQWATVGLSIVRSMVTVSNCTFSWLSYGIHIYNSTPVIDSCQFIDITMYGIKEDAGGQPIVSNCVFTHTTGTTYVGDYYDEELTILEPQQINGLHGNPANTGNHN